MGIVFQPGIIIINKQKATVAMTTCRWYCCSSHYQGESYEFHG